MKSRFPPGDGRTQDAMQSNARRSERKAEERVEEAMEQIRYRSSIAFCPLQFLIPNKTMDKNGEWASCGPVRIGLQKISLLRINPLHPIHSLNVISPNDERFGSSNFSLLLLSLSLQLIFSSFPLLLSLPPD